MSSFGKDEFEEFPKLTWVCWIEPSHQHAIAVGSLCVRIMGDGWKGARDTFGMISTLGCEICKGALGR